jgi:hypothetical protein
MNIKIYSEVYGNDKIALTIDENTKRVILATLFCRQNNTTCIFNPTHLQ